MTKLPKLPKLTIRELQLFHQLGGELVHVNPNVTEWGDVDLTDLLPTSHQDQKTIDLDDFNYDINNSSSDQAALYDLDIPKIYAKPTAQLDPDKDRAYEENYPQTMAVTRIKAIVHQYETTRPTPTN